MEREAAGIAGGTAALLAFVAEHERALTYDFRAKFCLPLSAVGSDVTYGEAIILIEGLLRETGSHLVAKMSGYDWVASHADVALITLSEWFMNVHRDRDKSPEPLRLPRPWPAGRTAPDVNEEERAALVLKLTERSALRDR